MVQLVTGARSNPIKVTHDVRTLFYDYRKLPPKYEAFNVSGLNINILKSGAYEANGGNLRNILVNEQKKNNRIKYVRN